MCEEPWNDLPALVREIQKELETASGAKVVWRKVDQLDGKMLAKWDTGRPVVQFREYSPDRAAHEFLHLLLDIEGYPNLSLCSRWSANTAGTILHNLLQHLMIFPRLKEMGFDHDSGECKANERLLGKIHGFPAECFEDEKSHHVNAMYASIIMRARLHGGEDALDRVIKPLCGINGIDEIRDLASSVMAKIQVGPKSTIEEYGAILDLCLKILNLDDILEARPPDLKGSNGP